jgi:acetylornithine/N-succinyldiaminopimelate aminotransferase
MPFITTYQPLPVTFSHGKGLWLYDTEGKAYFDAVTGIAVCGLGHAHPRVTETIQRQAGRLLHTSNGYHIEEQEKLAEKITRLTGMHQVFFSNSGAEANEAAIKLAKLFGHHKGIETPTIIVMERAFHGRTMATLTASGNRKIQAGFEPLVPGFVRAPFNDLNAIRTIAEHRKDIVGIMIEPIQGEGGIHKVDEAYLHAIKALCEAEDWLFILDEIQTGNGRTGQLYHFMHHGIQPDIFTTAKGLGNGVPVGATLMGKRASDLFKPGNHGSTFGGNPLAMATANTVLDVILEDNLLEKVTELGHYLRDQLFANLGQHPMIKAIRGQGYMLGIELDRMAADVRLIGLKQGILLNVTAETVIRLLPPLIMTKTDIDELVSRLTTVLLEFSEQK